MAETITVDKSLVEALNEKIDRLTSQVEFLTEEAQKQKRRQQEWDELKSDLIPVTNEAFALAVTQLEEVEQCVQLENITSFGKRLLRNTCNFQQMLDQLESLMGFWEDFSPLSRSVFLTAMNRLDEMERKGYFVFLQTMLNIGDDVITSFDQEDLERMRQTVVPMLEMLKELSQPEMVDKLQKAVAEMQKQDVAAPSLFGLLRQMNDPVLRKGLTKSLQAFKAVAE